MLLAILAAAATTAPALPPPRTVSPLVVTAQPKQAPPADATVDISGDDELPGSQHVYVWPRGAWDRKKNGHVTLTCFVDVHGLAERCRVAWEDPPGQGFGAAALELQPTLKLNPPKDAAGQPMAANMNIALTFKAPDIETNMQDLARSAGTGGQINGSNLALSGNPIDMRKVVMMNHPVWISAPGFEDLARAYPARAGGVEGYAVAHCEVLRKTGTLTRCVAAKELPGGRGFGPAAVKLASQFKVSPEAMTYAPHGDPIEVDIPIRFPAAAEAAARTVTAPAWISGVDPEAAPKLFPPEAAAKGVTTGRGMAKCTVTPTGGLTGCTPEAAEPEGLGFSEAAVKLASTMRMNLWSADAEPVEGGVVHVAIRLNLEQTAAR